MAASACEDRIKSWRETWRGKISDEDFSRMDKSMSDALAERKLPRPDNAREDERRAKLKQLDEAFEAYTQNYQRRLDEALKPGSRTDPISLQQEYLLKRRAYKDARKKLEK